MQTAGTQSGTQGTQYTLTPRTGVLTPGRPEDTAGGQVAPRTRRDFLKWTFFGTLLAILAGGAGGFLAYFYPKRTSSFGSVIAVPGTVADYPVGSVTRIREGKFYISHVPEGLLALY